MRVGEPCPICLQPGGPKVDTKQATCSSECGLVWKARRTQERRDRRYRDGLAALNVDMPAQVHVPEPVVERDARNVGISPEVPTVCHERVSVAERTRPVPWMPEPVTVPAPQSRTGRYIRVLVWPDTHLPYADPKAVSLALQIGRYYSPDLVILLGDILDCTGFSRFPHDQVNPKSFLQTELDEWHSLAESIREMAPHAGRRYLIGNHEERIERWLWSQPQLYGLTGMRLTSLLTLQEHGFRPEIEREIILCNGSLTVTHGTRIGGQGAGLAARQEMARHGTSGVSGHTHRLALVTQRDKAGLRQWIESGHLSLNPPHYQPSIQNWIQGLTLGEVSADGNDFELRPVPFRLSYRALVDGREFSA